MAFSAAARVPHRDGIILDPILCRQPWLAGLGWLEHLCDCRCDGATVRAWLTLSCKLQPIVCLQKCVFFPWLMPVRLAAAAHLTPLLCSESVELEAHDDSPGIACVLGVWKLVKHTGWRK